MAKTKLTKSKDREERIVMEIIVDAYGPEEQAMGRYYYLEEKLQYQLNPGDGNELRGFGYQGCSRALFRGQSEFLKEIVR